MNWLNVTALATGIGVATHLGIIFSGVVDPENQFILTNKPGNCTEGSYHTEGYYQGEFYTGCWVRDPDRDGVLIRTNSGEHFGVPIFVFHKENPDAN